MAKKQSVQTVTKQWDEVLEKFFTEKLPVLPKKAKEVLVKFGPWLVLVSVVLSLPTLLMALGLWTVFMPSYAGYGYAYGYNVTWWISIASMVLMAVAVPGLFKKQLSAWKLMFYGTLVMAVYDLITVSLGGLIIGSGLSLYILYQIKSYYK
jgi:hypothetical protein